jgi:hypothetical protein
MSANQPPDEKDPKELGLGPKLAVLLIALGTLALAIAWRLESHNLADVNDELFRLQRSQTVVEAFEIMGDQWQIALNQEITKEKPNVPFLTESAYKSLEATAYLQSYMAARTASDATKASNIFAAREAFIQQGKEFAKSGDYKSLLQLLEEHKQKSEALGLTSMLDDRFSDSVDDHRAQKRSIESGILLAYTLGTLLILAGNILVVIRAEFATDRAIKLIQSLKLRVPSGPRTKPIAIE